MNEKTIVNMTGNDPHKFAGNAETSGYNVSQRETDLSQFVLFFEYPYMLIIRK